MKFRDLVSSKHICYLTVDYDMYRMSRAHFSHSTSTTEMASGLTAEYPATPKHVLKTVATRLRGYAASKIPQETQLQNTLPLPNKNVSPERKGKYIYVYLALKAYRPSKKDTILCFSRS